MRVPVYDSAVKQSGVPDVRQNPNRPASDFANGTLATGLQMGSNLANQIGSAINQDLIADQKELDAQHKKALAEANQYRANDALNQFKSWQIDKLYGQDGALRKQGKSVFDQDGKPISQSVLDEADQFKSQLVAGLGNDEQRQLFALHANNQTNTLKQQLMGHEAEQYRVFQRSVNTGTIETEKNNIGHNYNNIDGITQSLAAIDQAIMRNNQVEGLDDSVGGALALKHKSDALKLGIESALSQGDHASATQILQKFSAHMDTNDMLKAYKTITDEHENKQAYTLGQQVMSAVYPKMQTNDTDRAFNILLGTESGNKHFAEGTNKPITSPKGAIGIAQVMPDTAPEAAKLAGIEWDEQRYRNDPEYNKALGLAYFKKQLTDFNGDVSLSYAAYNAGPGAARQAVNRAKKEGGNWLSYLPKETQNYVKKNIGEFNAGEGQYKKPSLADAISAADSALGDNASDNLRKKTRDEVTTQFNLQNNAIKQRSEEAVAEAYRQMQQNGGKFSDLPVAVKTDLQTYAPDKIDSVMNFGKRIQQGDPVQTDWSLYYQMKTDPALLRNANLMAFKDKLDDPEFKQLSGEQQSLMNGSSTHTRSAKDILNQFMKESGIDPTPKDDDKKGAAQVGRIWSVYDQQVAQAEADKGKALNSQELEQIAGKLFTNVAVKGTWYGTNDKPAVLVNFEKDKIKVPDDDRQQIIAAYKKGNQAFEPSEQDILNLYLKKRGLQ